MKQLTLDGFVRKFLVKKHQIRGVVLPKQVFTFAAVDTTTRVNNVELSSILHR